MPPKKGGNKKAGKGGPRGMSKPISCGLILQDLVKKQWKLGPVIGQGGFGYIYLGSKSTGSDVTEENAENVVKVEPHNNGPLFVELAFYHRVGKSEMVNAWTKSKKKPFIGLPLYIGSGSFDYEGDKYRFMVMDRYGVDMEKIYKNNNFQFPQKTVFSLGLRILDTLEYIHENEYVHADIKSSNLMMGFKKNKNKVYLLDYGLAYRYCPNGEHVPYKEDPKRKHDGTIEYTSRDAHLGCAPSRRGDLEILGYCMVQWLCKCLPWENKLTDKEYVMKEKFKYMEDIPSFMKKCFPDGSDPPQLSQYLNYVASMNYKDKPDYKKINIMFSEVLKKIGIKDDGMSVLLPDDKKPTDPSKTSQKRLSTENIKSPAKKQRVVNNKAIKKPPTKSNAKVKDIVSPTKLKALSPSNMKSPPKMKYTPSIASAKKIVTPRKLASPKKVESPAKKIIPKVGVRMSPRLNTVSKVELVNGQESNTDFVNAGRVIHRRIRKKNVPMVDFAQSP